MIKITAEVRAWIDSHAGDMELAVDEYIDPADGLIHCKHCYDHHNEPEAGRNQESARPGPCENL